MPQPTADLLAPLPDVKIQLGITTTAEDKLLTQLIGQLSALIIRSLNRTHLLSSNPINPVTWFLSGQGEPPLILPAWPIQSIVGVWEDETAYYGQAPGDFAAGTELTQGVDYVLRIDQPDGSSRSAMLLRIKDVWGSYFEREADMLGGFLGSGYGNIKVQAVVGYNAVPPDVELACIQAVAKVRNSKQYGQALVSERDEVFSYTLAVPADVRHGILSGDIAAMLAPYRIVPLPGAV